MLQKKTFARAMGGIEYMTPGLKDIFGNNKICIFALSN